MPQGETVEIFRDDLGNVLRGAARADLAPTFSGTPLYLYAEVPGPAAASVRRGAVGQALGWEIGKAVRAQIEQHVVPNLVAGRKIATADLQALMRKAEPELKRTVAPLIARHLQITGAVSAQNRADIKTGALATIGFTLSVASIAVTPFTGGISGAAGIFGIIRPVMEGLDLVARRLMTVTQTSEWIDSDLKRLISYYKAGQTTGVVPKGVLGGMAQTAGTFVSATSLFKPASSIARTDLLPTFDDIEKKVALLRAKIGEIYKLADRIIQDLNDLLDGFDALDAGAAQPDQTTWAALEARVSGLLDQPIRVRATRLPRHEGGMSFHRRYRDYSISQGLALVDQLWDAADVLDDRLTALRALERNPRTLAFAQKAVSLLTGVGFTAMSYPTVLASPPSIDFGGDSAKIGASNDAQGTLKDLLSALPLRIKDSVAFKEREQEASVAFAAAEQPVAIPTRRARGLVAKLRGRKSTGVALA